MKNLLKILGFIGSVAVGVTTVNYLIKSSKSDASSTVVDQASAQVINSSAQSKKLSRLAKIEQNYQPKALEEILVEYVQIATSDIDEGKKLPIIDAPVVQSTVKVDQAAALPFISRSTQPNMPMQSESTQDVYPQDNYYPGDYGNGMNYPTRNHQVPHNNVDQLAQEPAQSRVEYPATSEKSEPRRNHFRDINDDFSSNDSGYNSTIPVDNELKKLEEPAHSQESEKETGKGFDWKNSLEKLSSLLGAAQGLNWLYNKIISQSEPSLDGCEVKTVQLDKPLETNTNTFDGNPHSGTPVSFESNKSAQSTSTESTSAESTQKVQQESHKVKQKPGISNVNVVPNELPEEDHKLSTIGSGQSKGMFASTSPKLMKLGVQPVEMIDTNATYLESKLHKVESRRGISDTTVHIDELLEEDNKLSSADLNQSEKIEMLSSEKSKVMQIESEKKSLGKQLWDYVSSDKFVNHLDKALNRSEGRGMLILGLAPLLTVPYYVGSAALTALIPAATTSIIPSLTATTALAPIAATTTALVPAASTGLMTALSAKALMATKILVGLGGFAITKNPMYLLPK